MRYAIALALAGCSIVNDPSTLQRDEISADELCVEAAEMVCAEYESCCPSPIEEDFNCANMFESLCHDGLDDVIDDARVGYDPELAADVLAEGYSYIHGYDGHPSCDLEMADWFANRAGFTRFLAGTRRANEACPQRNDMDGNTFLSCAAPDLSCQVTLMGLECRPRHDEGGPCLSYLDCRDGLRCEPVVGDLGTCATRLPPGSPCADTADCESLVCEGDEGSKTCSVRTAAIFCTFLLGAP